jgi:hypothetical protein
LNLDSRPENVPRPEKVPKQLLVSPLWAAEV